MILPAGVGQRIARLRQQLRSASGKADAVVAGVSRVHPIRLSMSDLTIRLKRHPDGTASLTCVRADGTSTWQRQNGSLGQFFPPHDLTHYAVETTLGYRSGFYGLIAQGWSIDDFATPFPRGPIPVEALEVELIVSFFETERRSLTRMTEAEFNDHAERYQAARQSKRPGALGTAPRLSAEQIDAVRQCRSWLLSRWSGLGPGEAMELSFPASGHPIGHANEQASTG
jgi:hypothetical protein